jgi:DNA-binding transcriptional MerR regulator
MGLVASPPGSESNYRLYPQEAVRRVQFIKHAQELGYSLKEIMELLALRATPETPDSSPRGSMMVACTDLIVADHSRSAQRRVHFINASPCSSGSRVAFLNRCAD